MTEETLQKGNDLSMRIQKAEIFLRYLYKPELTVSISLNALAPLTTIGVDDNCEHHLADEARGFILVLETKYLALITSLKAELAAL